MSCSKGDIMLDFLSFTPENSDCDFERVEKLRKRMNSRIPTICPERAEIVTRCYKNSEDEPIVLRRAKAFAEVLDNMTVYIEPDSLIIGNQASVNFAAPIFPEYSFEWVIEELDEFEHRSGDYFKITEETKDRLRVLRDYWIGKTHQEEVLSKLSQTNLTAEKQKVLHRAKLRNDNMFWNCWIRDFQQKK